jgi:hypothetical protein
MQFMILLINLGVVSSTDEDILTLTIDINRVSYDLYEIRNVDIPDDGPRFPLIARRIASFSSTQCWERFRIRKEHLER